MSGIDNPKISIVIPAYNKERVIGKVVRSVLYVIGKDCEIIVVDDGS